MFFKRFCSNKLLSLILLNVFCFFSQFSLAQTDSVNFRVIAFYSASWDAAHISFAHECNRWFPKMAKEYGFEYDSTNNWNNLNREFLAQYQVVLFLDNSPSGSQKNEFEQYMREGGSWMGFHVCAFNQNPSAWDWYYNQFLGMGSYKSNTWAPSTAILQVENQTHPSTINLPETFTASVNEWYAWTTDLRTKSNIDILCSVHASSFPLGDGSGAGGASEIWRSGYYPVVWTNTDYNMIYINMGHNAVNYSNNTDKSHTFGNPVQDKLVLDALFWLASKNKPDPRATNIEILSPEDGQQFLKPAIIPIEIAAADSDGIAKVEFFNNTTLLAVDSVSPYQFSWENVGIGSYTVRIKVSDSLNNVVSSAVNVNVQGQGAYRENIAQIPGKVEAENFDYGGQGVGYSDSEAANQGNSYRAGEGVDIEASTDAGGGYNVGYTAAGEWLKFTVNVTEKRAYTLQTRVASTNSGKKFHVELNGINITGSVTVPRTGGWQVWQTVNVVTPVLETGEQELKFVFDTDGFNLNYINFSNEILGSNKLEYPVGVIFPNPSNGVFSLQFEQKLQSYDQLVIFDGSGKKIKTIDGKLFAGKDEIKIDISSYGKGIFLITLNGIQNPIKVLVE